MTLWRVMFLAELYGRMRLTLPEIAEQIGISEQTIRNRRARGDLQWIKVDGRDLFADVADVAAYLEQQRAQPPRTSREETPA